MRKLVKILSIDGGGIRGIVPAMLLAEIERRTQRQIAKLFDLVAGTSTGGILALALTIPKNPRGPLYRAAEFAGMYAREGPRIFSRSLWHKLSGCNNLMNAKYSSAGIERVLEEFFGDSRLAHAATSVLVTCYEIERNFPFFFKSSNARIRSSHDFPARQVARAVSAAPTYFEPMKLPTGTNTDHFTLIDGGVYANNPAACALVEARTTHPEAGGFLVVSLGTGSLRHSLRYDAAGNWGVAKWAAPLLSVVFDGVSSTVDYQMRQLMPDVSGHPKRYYRFQTGLDPRHHSLDNTCAANIAALQALANNLIEKRSGDLDELCDTLVAK
jgi:patatin-like phospholipase/acyl hydrolase